jgi:hypothetical protein
MKLLQTLLALTKGYWRPYRKMPKGYWRTSWQRLETHGEMPKIGLETLRDPPNVVIGRVTVKHPGEKLEDSRKQSPGTLPRVFHSISSKRRVYQNTEEATENLFNLRGSFSNVLSTLGTFSQAA